MKICKVKNCNNDYFALGYCNRHYQQKRRYGRILKRTAFDKNTYIKCNNFYKIYLFNVKHEKVGIAKISLYDYKKVKKHKWFLHHSGYVRSGTAKNLHCFILGYKKGLMIDHINHIKLDCRRSNLRFVTNSQNLMNNKCKGYSWHKIRKKWQVSITVNYKQIYIGLFKKEENAIKARKKAEIKYFGKFAFNNKFKNI